MNSIRDAMILQIVSDLMTIESFVIVNLVITEVDSVASRHSRDSHSLGNQLISKSAETNLDVNAMEMLIVGEA